MEKIKTPMKDRVIIRLDKIEHIIKKGKLYIVSDMMTKQRKYLEGNVIAVSADIRQLEVGDRVITKRGFGLPFDFQHENGETKLYLIVSYDQIEAKIC